MAKLVSVSPTRPLCNAIIAGLCALIPASQLLLFPDVPPNNYQLTIVSHGHEVGHARLLPLSAPAMQPSSRLRIGTKLVLLLKQSRFTLDGRNVGAE